MAAIDGATIEQRLAEAIFGPASYGRASDDAKRTMREHARGVMSDLGLVAVYPTNEAPASMQETPHDPPFDGSDPCPACPWQVRDLAATAHNLLIAIDSKDWPRVFTKTERVRESLKRFQTVVDRHFADRAHSHGDIRSREPKP